MSPIKTHPHNLPNKHSACFGELIETTNNKHVHKLFSTYIHKLTKILVYKVIRTTYSL
jgi:hypothetical protein